MITVSSRMSADYWFNEQIIPAAVERLTEMSSMKENYASQSDVGGCLKRCQACSTEKNVDELSRCKGCESVWYCDKVGDVKTWLGHKQKADSGLRTARQRAGMREAIRLTVRFYELWKVWEESRACGSQASMRDICTSFMKIGADVLFHCVWQKSPG